MNISNFSKPQIFWFSLLTISSCFLITAIFNAIFFQNSRNSNHLKPTKKIALVSENINQNSLDNSHNIQTIPNTSKFQTKKQDTISKTIENNLNNINLVNKQNAVAQQSIENHKQFVTIILPNNQTILIHQPLVKCFQTKIITSELEIEIAHKSPCTELNQNIAPNSSVTEISKNKSIEILKNNHNLGVNLSKTPTNYVDNPIPPKYRVIEFLTVLLIVTVGVFYGTGKPLNWTFKQRSQINATKS